MKKLILMLAAAMMAGAIVWSVSAQAKKEGTLRHVVCFKYKATATEEQIQKVENDFRALKSKISGIKTFECGVNVSPEKLNKGITHAFQLSFGTEADRDVYLKHPDHQAFAKSLGPVLDDVFVMDYWAKP
ncbi:MAG: Dabb family protein [Verrucomicrobiota bacterium]